MRIGYVRDDGITDWTKCPVAYTGILKRGADEYRCNAIFRKSEIVFTTDTRKVYIGDGMTIGGLYVGDIPAEITGDLHMYADKL